MLLWTWWLLTLYHHGRLYRVLQTKLQVTRNLWMHAFLNYNSYMDLQKERKSTFSLRSNIRKKKLALVLYNIDIVQLSQNVFVIWKLYLIQTPNVCSGKYLLPLVHPVSATDDSAFCGLSLGRHTNSVAAVENNFTWFCISLAHI